MRSAILACLLAVLPFTVHADKVATQSEEAALRSQIARNPPTAATLSAQPYPGSKLDVTCSADQSAPRQPTVMVYCFYTKDPLDKVKAYLAGPGKPGASVDVFAADGAVVADERNNVIVDGVTRITYYVRSSAPDAPQPAAATPPSAPAAAPVAASAPTPAPSATSPKASAPQTDTAEKDDGSEAVEEAVETGKKLKGLLGF